MGGCLLLPAVTSLLRRDPTQPAASAPDAAAAAAAAAITTASPAPSSARAHARRRRRPSPHATAAELGGDLDKVKRFVKLTAFVNCVDSYTAQPKVANGASDLLGEIFGDAGKHARSAVGVNALPLNVPVEIEGESRRAAPRGAQPARGVRTHAFHAKGGDGLQASPRGSALGRVRRSRPPHARSRAPASTVVPTPPRLAAIVEVSD